MACTWRSKAKTHLFSFSPLFPLFSPSFSPLSRLFFLSFFSLFVIRSRVDMGCLFLLFAHIALSILCLGQRAPLSKINEGPVHLLLYLQKTLSRLSAFVVIAIPSSFSVSNTHFYPLAHTGWAAAYWKHPVSR